jgi:hypothetical protein
MVNDVRGPIRMHDAFRFGTGDGAVVALAKDRQDGLVAGAVDLRNCGREAIVHAASQEASLIFSRMSPVNAEFVVLSTRMPARKSSEQL